MQVFASVKVYVIGNVPTPAVPGLKVVPPVTPVPEYVPPAGLPPERVKLEASTQTELRALKVTLG